MHGFGEEAGAPLVEHPDVAVVSFTGSCEVGRWIAETAGRRLAKICLELGGKNPLIVCDDADLANAVTWTLGSAFSNAGQRCAAGSRIIVFDAVYDRFKAMLVEAAGRAEGRHRRRRRLRPGDQRRADDEHARGGRARAEPRARPC